MNKKIQQ